MSELTDRFLCLSSSDRDWVIRRLSLGQRHKLGLILGVGEDTSVIEAAVPLEGINIWRTEEISRFDNALIVQVMNDMPHSYLQILFHYEGNSARDYFVKHSKRKGLVSRVLSSDITDMPEQYGVIASDFFLRILRESV